MRNELVFGFCARGLPLVVTMGGGYSRPIEHSAAAHTDVFAQATAAAAAWWRGYCAGRGLAWCVWCVFSLLETGMGAGGLRYGVRCGRCCGSRQRGCAGRIEMPI